MAKITVSREVDREFLEAGRAIFTVELNEVEAYKHGRPHFSYQISLPAKAKTGSRNFEVRWLKNGSADLKKFVVLGTYNAETGIFTQNSKADWNIRATIVFREALKVILAGRLAVERFQSEGGNLHPSNRCCRCAKLLTAPSSCETGIGPECESYAALGIKSVDEVPTRRCRLVASLQLAYWMNGDKGCLAALRDACLDAGFDDVQADALVSLTRATMRKFKKGKCLCDGWLAFARS